MVWLVLSDKFPDSPKFFPIFSLFSSAAWTSTGLYVLQSSVPDNAIQEPGPDSVFIDDGRPYGFTCWRDTVGAMHEAHAHNDIEINFCHRSISYMSGGEHVTVPGRHLTAFWGARPHQLLEHDLDTEIVWITIPLAEFLSWSVPEACASRLLNGDILTASAQEFDDTLEQLLATWCDDFRQRSETRRRAARLEIAGLMLRFALISRAPITVRSGAPGSDVLQRVADMTNFITRSYGRDIRVADIANVAHISQQYASAIFAQVFGMSIITYLNKYRIAEAQRLLLTTDHSVQAIGSLVGFKSPSAFYENFAKYCKTTPRGFRKHQEQ